MCLKPKEKHSLEPVPPSWGCWVTALHRKEFFHFAIFLFFCLSIFYFLFHFCYTNLTIWMVVATARRRFGTKTLWLLVPPQRKTLVIHGWQATFASPLSSFDQSSILQEIFQALDLLHPFKYLGSSPNFFQIGNINVCLPFGNNFQFNGDYCHNAQYNRTITHKTPLQP